MPSNPMTAAEPGPSPRCETRPCPVCAASDHEPLFEREGWRLARCSGCGLAYMPTVPTDEAIDTDFEWSESFAREKYERWMRNPLARAYTMAVLFMKPSREKRALSIVRRYVRAGRLLDVGCGDGRLLMHAQRAGFDVLGVEPSPKMAARAKRRIGPDRVLVGRVGDFPLEKSGFDAVVTVSYVEHEPRPGPALRQFHELLRPGGVCLHKTPNYDSQLRRILGRRWSGYRFPEHVQYFTPELLSRLMTESGFEVLATHANPLGDNFWIAARRPER